MAKAKNASADLIKNEGKRAKVDLRGDTNFTQNQLDSIFANLGTTGRGVSRALDRSQSRTLGAMNRLAARTRGSAYAKNDQVTQHLTNRYGTAMGSAITQQMKPANAQAKATALDTVGGQQAAGLLAKGGQLGLKTEQAAAREARAGADYAMAAAYQDRAVALAEARLTQQQEKEDAAKTHLSDAQDQITELAANGKNRGDAMRTVQALALRYNLNQKETAKLEDYVNTLYPEGEGAYVLSSTAETPVDANGNPLSQTMDPQDKEFIRSKVAGWFTAGNSLDDVLQAAHKEWMNEDGTPTATPDFFDELNAYVSRMYATLDESAPSAKKPPSSTGTGNVASKAQRAQAAKVGKALGVGAQTPAALAEAGAHFARVGEQSRTAAAPAPAVPSGTVPSVASVMGATGSGSTYSAASSTMDSVVRERVAQNGGRALSTTDIDQIMYQLYQRYGVHVLRSDVVRSAAKYR